MYSFNLEAFVVLVLGPGMSLEPSSSSTILPTSPGPEHLYIQVTGQLVGPRPTWAPNLNERRSSNEGRAEDRTNEPTMGRARRSLCVPMMRKPNQER